MHGGASLRGAESPRFGSGKYSRFLPPKLRQSYEEALTSPLTFQFRDEISTIEALIGDQLALLSGEGPKWQEARGCLEKLHAAMKARDLTAAAAALSQLGGVFEGADQFAEAFDRVVKLNDLRRRMISTEVKRVKAAAETLTAEQAMALMAAVVSAITAEIQDPATLRRIDAHFQRIVSHPGMTDAAPAVPGLPGRYVRHHDRGAVVSSDQQTAGLQP